MYFNAHVFFGNLQSPLHRFLPNIQFIFIFIERIFNLYKVFTRILSWLGCQWSGMVQNIPNVRFVHFYIHIYNVVYLYELCYKLNIPLIWVRTVATSLAVCFWKMNTVSYDNQNVGENSFVIRYAYLPVTTMSNDSTQ